MRSLLLLALFGYLTSCSDEVQVSTLQTYLNEAELMVQDSSVIACAAGASDSVNIFYFPEVGYSDFRLWRLMDPQADPSDFGAYAEVSYPELGLFNGYLRYYQLLGDVEETWFTISGRNDQEIVVAQPIKLKHEALPTEVDESLLSIDQSELLSPSFQWQEGSYAGTVIYFQVVSDQENNLISGTYTLDQSWTFYDLSNVVLNIRDVSPAPMLGQDQTYTFSMMGVSQDNWVNLFLQVPFRTSE